MYTREWILAWEAKQKHNLSANDAALLRKELGKDDIALWSEPFLATIAAVTRQLLVTGGVEEMAHVMEANASYERLITGQAGFQDAAEVMMMLMERYPPQTASAYETTFVPKLYGDNGELQPYEGTVFKNIFKAIPDALLYRKTAVTGWLGAAQSEGEPLCDKQDGATEPAAGKQPSYLEDKTYRGRDEITAAFKRHGRSVKWTQICTYRKDQGLSIKYDRRTPTLTRSDLLRFLEP